MHKVRAKVLKARVGILKNFLVMMLLGLGFLVQPLANAASAGEPYRPLHHLWYGTRDLPDTQNYIVLGVGTAVTLGALALDNSVHDFFHDKNRLGGWEKIGDNVLGTGIPGVVWGAVSIGYGLWAEKQHELDAGEAHLEALLVSTVYTNILKYTVRRPRPDSSNTQSFPSGHTSTMFTSAANLMDMYGPTFGVPALVLAGFTGVGRMASNAHHLSDVLFGATLGYVVGHAYTRHHNAIEEAAPEKVTSRINIIPYYSSTNDCGVMAQARF